MGEENASWARIYCINQDTKVESNLSQFEQKFVAVPYKKIKKPRKERTEKDLGETEDLYFERVTGIKSYSK